MDARTAFLHSGAAMTTPIPNCPQEDKPIRDRAWTDEQIVSHLRDWAADQRERFGWGDSDAGTDRYCAGLLSAAADSIEAKTALNATIGAAP